jgi:hypothetical protein
MDHQTSSSTQGESSLHGMETHFNVQRRLYDSQFSLTTPPVEFAQAQQTFRELSNPTAPQGLRKDQCGPPRPLVGRGEAQGRLYRPAELARTCARARFPRTTNRYGCVTVQRSPF